MIDGRESAYRAGRIACAEAKRKDQNPHDDQTQEHAFWNRGWNEEFSALPEPLKALRLPRVSE